MAQSLKWSQNRFRTQRVVRAPRAGVVALLVAVVGCSGAQSGEARYESARTPKVLLIGIDGVRPDVLSDVATPNLDRLAAAGSILTDVRTTTPSVSGPSWSSMLTGVWPEKHGVTSNDFVAPRYGDYPDFLTRLERARPELVTWAVADWTPLIELPGRTPAVGLEVDTREALDGYEVGWAEADRRSVSLAVLALETADPDALFVYLGNPDEASHQQGSIGAGYRDAIGLADTEVGRLVRAIESRPTYRAEDWLVLVSTDHGRRADGGHGGDSPEEMTIFILVSGRAVADGTTAAAIVDVAPTALVHLGIAIDQGWGLDGRPLPLR